MFESQFSNIMETKTIWKIVGSAVCLSLFVIPCGVAYHKQRTLLDDKDFTIYSLKTYRVSFAEDPNVLNETHAFLSSALEVNQSSAMKALNFSEGLNGDTFESFRAEGKKLRSETTELKTCTPGTVKKWDDYSKRIEEYTKQGLPRFMTFSLTSRKVEDLSREETIQLKVLQPYYLTPHQRHAYEEGCKEAIDIIGKMYRKFLTLECIGLSALSLSLVWGVLHRERAYQIAMACCCAAMGTLFCILAIGFLFSSDGEYLQRWVAAMVLFRLAARFLGATAILMVEAKSPMEVDS